MIYLHSHVPPIVHRDLKTHNLMVDKNGTVKVGDFGNLFKYFIVFFIKFKIGLSRVLDKSRSMTCLLFTY
jgi:serine/threonine protein kinase